jgi:hypothetical protein
MDDRKDLEKIIELIAYSSTHHILKGIDNMLCDHPDYNEWMGIKSVSGLSNDLINNINYEIQEYWDTAVDEND